MVNFEISNALLARAKNLIPLASQTFSKSYLQYPMRNVPRFVDRAEGCRMWDVDGNEYIDLVSALAAIILGYCDRDVNEAVGRQLERGTIFSLPHELEVELAERITSLCPNVEQVRFGKNGSDVTTAAIRLARAVTGRQRVAVCGYHGWHDWYIGSTTMNQGVPEVVAALTHSFSYNNIESLENILNTYPQEFAAIILEPANSNQPQSNFLHDVRELATRTGALLIFDETITGFRYALGGAQQYFGVTADLVTYGKALGNGFPISCLGGPASLMQRISDIFFSFTFGGEALSLQAACATLDKLKNSAVLDTIRGRGSYFKQALQDLIETNQMSLYCNVVGDPTWFFITFNAIEDVTMWELKTFFMQEMIKRGVLTMGSHNLNFAHDRDTIDKILQVYKQVLPLIAEAVKSNKVAQWIEGEPLRPLFTIR